MIQSGDPTGTGRGGTSIYGNKLFVNTYIVTNSGRGYMKCVLVKMRSILSYDSLALE